MKNWMLKLAPVLVLILSAAAQACPMCKDSIPNSDAQSATMVPGAVNNSIFLMFAAFTSCLGLIVHTLVKGARTSQPPRGGRGGRGFPLDRDDVASPGA